MSGLFDTTPNYSFYAIPGVWVLSLFPHLYAATASKSFDNRTPRGYTKCLDSDQTLDKSTKERIARAEGAQQNGFENIGLFASAVVAGNLAGLPSATLNTLAGGYFLSRLVYNVVYITNTSETMANVRTAVFLGGIAQIMTLFVKSGNALMNRAPNLI
ncbi:hypothetical protein D0Z07_8421 [Hyphodiscus hymeniophilus]|uniref:Uncharacterized protein n=1 Tax=Hyphodiscus hymeniophilus TaxID=353542 RepID=A0A9P6VED9_9HELO|nr:hypothetical protein D0Z07_8421 [Hyphodiscus hymeniophilus]